jgi:hypothetical protein
MCGYGTECPASENEPRQAFLSLISPYVKSKINYLLESGIDDGRLLWNYFRG